jgi:hypothetical protein
MESRTLWVNARDHNYEFPGQWAISVASAPGWSAEEIALAAPFRNRDMRVSTVGEVRLLGHDVVVSDEPPHADLVLACEPTEETWEALREVFELPVANPRYSDEEM